MPTEAPSDVDPEPAGSTLEAVIGCLGEGLLVVDHTIRVVLLNPRGTEILRTAADQVIGRSFDDPAATWRLRDRGPYAVWKLRHHLRRGIAYLNHDAFVVTEEFPLRPPAVGGSVPARPMTG